MIMTHVLASLMVGVATLPVLLPVPRGHIPDDWMKKGTSVLPTLGFVSNGMFAGSQLYLIIKSSIPRLTLVSKVAIGLGLMQL